jgi:uncharacterized protein
MAETKLPLPSRIMATQYKVYDRMRHRKAFEVAREPGTATDFAEFEGERQALIVTFKRAGGPVPTPVNFAVADGKLYFRSEPHVAKIRRIRANPHVRVCPCNIRGKPRGEMVEGAARILPESENERAHAIVASNWRADMKPFERLGDRVGVPMVYVEVTPTAAESPATP